MLSKAVLLHSPEEVEEAIDRVARGLNERFEGKEVLVCPLMEGAIVFAGKLLTRLTFPVRVQALKVSRYRGSKGSELTIKGDPPAFEGAHVLYLDEILDEGLTLRMMYDLATESRPRPKSITMAVLVEKRLSKPKPIKADFVGLYVEENQFVVGEGMDYDGLGRNYNGIWDIRC